MTGCNDGARTPMMTHPADARSQVEATAPEFRPHRWLRGGHAQTIAGRYLPGSRCPLPSVAVEIEAGDGDVLIAAVSTPATWQAGDPVAVLVHGLTGCAEAPYVVRVAALLLRDGVRVVRMNLRGAGPGFGRARRTYHAGRSDDVRRVAARAAAEAPGSPIGLVGFSLGGNLVLKLAAEAAADPLDGLDCVVAANPPVDLAASCRFLRRPQARAYDRNFVRALTRDVRRLHAIFPELGPVNLPRRLSLYEFDDRYTAPRNGFEGADDYYERSSSGPLIPRIDVPGLVIHAADDPFIPVEPIRAVAFPRPLALELVAAGGHLGYLSHAPWRGSRRWLDHRIADWLARRWAGRRPRHVPR